MTKAIITSFHNYSYSLGTGYYKLFFDYFVAQLPLWIGVVDHVYILDTNWDLSKEELLKLPQDGKITYCKTPTPGHHTFQYQEFIPYIKEDAMLFVDNDVLIYGKSGVSAWFNILGDHDAVVEWINRGGITEPLWEKFPEMKARNATCMQMAHFLITKKLIKKIIDDRGGLDFMNHQPFPEGTYIPELEYTTRAGDWCESFGRLGYQILKYNNWIEPSIDKAIIHLQGGSNAYLLPSYKEKGLPQYEEFLQSQSTEKILKYIAEFLIIGGDRDMATEMIKDTYRIKGLYD